MKNLSERYPVPFLVTLILFVAECYFLLYFNTNTGAYVNPVICLLLSLSICLIPLFLKNIFSGETENHDNKGQIGEKNMTWIIFFSSAFILFVFYLREFIGGTDYAAMSDIIPVIEISAKRFINGETVYQPVHFSNYDTESAYLPFKWLPFVIPVILHFDPRWMAVIILFTGLFFYHLFLSKRNYSTIELVVKSLLPFFVVLMFAEYQPDIFECTAESLDAGFYLLFFCSIFSRSNGLRALAVLLCVLSRFSLAFWLPLYFGLIFLKERKNLLPISIITVAGVLFIYIIPFLSKDWGAFLRGNHSYTMAFIGEWNHTGDTGLPMHLFMGRGGACYFYSFVSGSIENRVSVLETSLIIISVLSVAVAGIFYFFNKEKYDHRLFSLLSLKFYFSFFYFLLPVPYGYLFIVPLLLSAFIVSIVGFNASFGTIKKEIAN